MYGLALKYHIHSLFVRLFAKEAITCLLEAEQTLFKDLEMERLYEIFTQCYHGSNSDLVTFPLC
jgi:hypothetical protein